MMALIAMFMMTAFSMTCEAAQKIVAVMPMSQIVNKWILFLYGAKYDGGTD